MKKYQVVTSKYVLPQNIKEEQRYLDDQENKEINSVNGQGISICLFPDFGLCQAQFIDRNHSEEEFLRTFAKSYNRWSRLEQAEIHRKANFLKKEYNNKQEKCECCNIPINGKKFSVFCKNQDLVPLGPSFPLFFIMITYLVAILSVIFFSYLVPYLVFLLLQGEKITFQCLMTPGVKEQFIDLKTYYFHLISLTFGYLTYILLKRKLIKQSIIYSISSQDISSYSLLLFNSSLEQTEDQIKQNFQVICDNIIVRKITFTYNLQQIIKQQKFYQKEIDKYIQQRCKHESTECFYQIIQEYGRKLRESVLSFNKEKRLDSVFVTFQTKYQAQKVFQFLNLSSCDVIRKLLTGGDQQIRVIKAPSPEEIF